MLLWSLCTALWFFFAFTLAGLLQRQLHSFRNTQEIALWDLLRHRTEGLVQDLETGNIPLDADFESLVRPDAPWTRTLVSGIQTLRERGAPLIPTLKRVLELSKRQKQVLIEARNKAAPALGQAGMALMLGPFQGLAFYFLIPSLSDSRGQWFLVCSFSFCLSALGALEVISMADRARRAGVSQRDWEYAIQSILGLESLQAVIRSGVTADQAYSDLMDGMQEYSPGLCQIWGTSLWLDFEGGESAAPLNRGLEAEGLKTALLQLGSEIRYTLQWSLRQGAPCLERLQSVQCRFEVAVRSSVDIEVGKLSTQALRPLFMWVAPASLGLMGAGLWLGFSNSGAF